MVACLLAVPATAQELRPAPDYFVEAAMWMTTANILAVNCRTLSVDSAAAAQLSGEVLDRLTQDGFSPQTLPQEMEDPSGAIAVLQDAFVARHGLTDGASQEAVCDAGLAEIGEATGIGALLLEVEG